MESVLSCFFIGHRDAPDELRSMLAEAVERHIADYGVRSFVVGHYGAFDRMAASAVLDAKKHHDGVTLQLLIPYHPAERPVKPREGFDGTFYPPGMERVPHRLAIIRANTYMIRNSTHLIAYAHYRIGNTADFFELAKRLEQRGSLSVENLAELI